MSGDIPQKKRKRAAVIRRDGTNCYWCGTKNADTLDHVIPRSMGGTHVISNLVLACEDCNQERGGVHGPGSHQPGMPSRPKKSRPAKPCRPAPSELSLEEKLQQLAAMYPPSHERRARVRVEG